MGTLFIQTRGHTGAAQMTQVAYAAFGSGFQLQSLLPYLVPGFLEAYLKHIGVGILQNDTGLQIALPVYGEGATACQTGNIFFLFFAGDKIVSSFDGCIPIIAECFLDRKSVV